MDQLNKLKLAIQKPYSIRGKNPIAVNNTFQYFYFNKYIFLLLKL